MKNTVWIVAVEDPKPDDYIPILVKSREEASLSVSHKVFNNEASAILFATELTEKYGVRSIRIFHADGHSEKIQSE